MLIVGLTNNPKTKNFLRETGDLSFVESKPSLSGGFSPEGFLPGASSLETSLLAEIPTFFQGTEFFLGGHRQFYTLLPESVPADLRMITAEAKKHYGQVQFNLSLPFDPGTRLVNWVLDLRSATDPERRFDLYEKKTRNLVRKSHKNNFSLKVGEVPADFYRLYRASMNRLASSPKAEAWFTRLKKVFGEDAVTVSLFDGERLIGSNYCLVAGEYVLLMFNVSDPAYWPRAINDRLYDELVKWAIGKGVRYLDFGPSTIGDDSHNHFKEGFGTKKYFLYNAESGSVGYRGGKFLARRWYNLKLRFRSLYANRQIIVRYLVSGGTAAFTDIGLLYVLTKFVGLWYLASAVLAFIVAFGVSFTLQKFWTFQDKDLQAVKRQAGLYFLAAIVNLCLNTLLVYLMTDFLGIFYVISQVIAAGLVAIWSFFVYKYYVFGVNKIS